MTTAAWVTLIVTWSVIAFFTGRFLFLVIRKPPSGPDEDLGAHE